jgi:hypothetical protein
MKVEYAKLPSVKILVTNGVLQKPGQVVINAPEVVGKSEDPTVPVT